MDQKSNPSNVNNPSLESETQAKGDRREALRKIAKYSAYTAPALLASISGKATSAS